MVKITAIIAITILDIVALLNGIDGILFSLCVAAISSIAGYEFGIKRRGKNVEEKTREKSKFS